MRQQKLLHALGRLHADRGGNFAILFSVSAMVLMLSGGIAVDFTRAMSAKSAMANALDAAVLSTAHRISTGEIEMEEAQAELHSFFVANMQVPEESFDRYQIENVQFDDATKTLHATAAHGYETMFRFFGENNAQTIRTSSAAVYGSSFVEVAMTFDVTDSMDNDGKIDALKEAAVKGIEDLLSRNQPGKESIRISAIPYAQAVNVGDLSHYVWPDSGMDVDRTISLATREAAMESVSGTPEDMLYGAKNPDNCATERKGGEQYSTESPRWAMINRDGRLNSAQCPAATLIPLTHDQDVLTAAIRGYETVGMTAGHIGIQWAWYTLSYEWAEVLPASAKPLKPDDEDVPVHKYAVIMTDGEFNTAYAGSTREDPEQNEERLSRYHTNALCSAMKNKGIKIFTVGFALTDLDAIETLKSCATPDTSIAKYFYDTSTGAELTSAYEEIAVIIQALRLVH